MLTKASHWTLSWTKWIQSALWHPISVLILFFYLPLSLSSSFFASYTQTNIWYAWRAELDSKIFFRILTCPLGMGNDFYHVSDGAPSKNGLRIIYTLITLLNSYQLLKLIECTVLKK
jgi:hypothetical protein